jgi:hypothetical protein
MMLSSTPCDAATSLSRCLRRRSLRAMFFGLRDVEEDGSPTDDTDATLGASVEDGLDDV